MMSTKICRTNALNKCNPFSISQSIVPFLNTLTLTCFIDRLFQSADEVFQATLLSGALLASISRIWTGNRIVPERLVSRLYVLPANRIV